MAKGRKPKPTALKKLAGNPGKKALPENEPQPKKDRPPKPTNMSGTASKLWDDLSDELFNMGVLTSADGLALRMLCESFDRFMEARRIVASYGSMTYETSGPSGLLIKVNPAVGIMERANTAIRSWCSEFGLSPAARARVEKALDDGENDELEGLFTGETGPGESIRGVRH